jgi:hypothetical protein
MKIKSFYKLNNKFNENLISLYEDDKRKGIIGKYMKLIKEDKILRDQYNMFSQLEEGVDAFIIEDKSFAKEYLDGILKPFEKYSKKEINESNEKLFNFLKKNNLINDENIINEDKLSSLIEFILYEGNQKNTGECILKKLSAINELKTKSEKEQIIEQKSIEEKIEDFNNKYSGTLTSEEMNIVKSLMTHTNNDKPEVLKEYQKNVLNKLNVIIKETTDIELKDKYLQLKEQVLFDDETVQLFEINKLINEISEKEE